jgi:hypothetical protein
MHTRTGPWLGLALAFTAICHSAEGAEKSGQFWRVWWYERGIEHHNPAYEQRFRVNSPEVVLHPIFGKRVEARENGMMLIRAEEDLSLLTAAQLYLEMWGGHPGTANKRVTINGRSTYFLPRAGTEEMNCTYHYPLLPLKLTDLVNGHNAVQFAIDQGSTFWGHMLVDNACLRVALTNGHPAVVQAGLAGFSARVKAGAARASSTGEPSDAIELRLEIDGDPAVVESVYYQGRYYGYDENGDGDSSDWHGFTKGRQPVAWLGSRTNAPSTVTWDTSMLPGQKDVAVRALVRFRPQTNLFYLTDIAGGLEIDERPGCHVTLYSSHNLPRPFWSRANQKRTCTLYVDADPARIERAELHVNAWTGGAGEVKEYFKLNGHPFPVAEGSRHELIYSQLRVPASVLRQGFNEIELLSDTEHHGIEILLPGPCLMVRSREK